MSRLDEHIKEYKWSLPNNFYNLMDEIRFVGHREAKLFIRSPPIEAMVTEKQNPSELTGDVEIRPVDPGSVVAAFEKRRL